MLDEAQFLTSEMQEHLHPLLDSSAIDCKGGLILVGSHPVAMDEMLTERFRKRLSCRIPYRLEVLLF